MYQSQPHTIKTWKPSIRDRIINLLSKAKKPLTQKVIFNSVGAKSHGGSLNILETLEREKIIKSYICPCCEFTKVYEFV
jgi:hypothetical protein